MLRRGKGPEQIANTLYDACGSRRVSTISAAASQYDGILEVPPESQREPSALSKLYIRSSNNKPIPLSAVTRLKARVSRLSINHIEQLPAMNFEFNTKKGVSLSEATDAAREAAHEIGLPDTMTLNFQGASQEFEHALRGLTILSCSVARWCGLMIWLMQPTGSTPLQPSSGSEL